MKREQRVLIVDDSNSGLYLEGLVERFPGVVFDVATTTEEVDEKAKLGPTILFSWHCEVIDDDAQHRVAVLPSMEWIQISGAGYDHLGSLHESGAVLTNAGGVLSDFMTEAVVTMVLAMNYRLHDFVAQQRRSEWHKLLWSSVRGKTVLVVGLGRIGRKVSLALKNMGMHIIGLRHSDKPADFVDEQIAVDGLHAALARADFVCLHCPLTEETRGLIGSAELAAMKSDAILLNTARGGVVDEPALIEALQNKQIGGAYLDVVSADPLPATSPLWQLDNVILTPHISDSVTGWQQLFVDFFADNLEHWLNDEPLEKVIAS